MTPLQVLVVDDSDDDAELLLSEIRRGYQAKYERAWSPEAVREALKKPWDIVISDWAMPNFSGLDAFELVRETGVDLPFILVSGSIDEEIAVSALKAGVHDFMMKGRYARLLPSIARELREAENRRRKRAAEDQLRHAQKMDAVGRLAGGVAHDFNNVLTVIQTLARFLEESLAPGTERDDAVDIRRAAERGAAITRQLLTVSRHSIVAPEPIKLNDVVAGFTPMLRRLVGDQVSLVVHSAEVPAVIGDRSQLEQVLMNLAVNARDAMPTGGRLTIETSEVQLDEEAAAVRGLQAGRYVRLEVTDTGTGMDEDTRRCIFDPFFTTKEPGKGTGLGLSIVHGIVTQAGGQISVYSELGHGTTFRTFLPVTDESARATVREEPASPRSLPPVTALVVDDQHDVRAVVVRVLEEAGCRVLEAPTADVARQICVSHEGPIEVAVLDVALTDGRGDLLVGELRALRPSIRTVLMSGFPAGALTQTGAAPPDLLPKPFSPAELRGAVARALGVGDTAPPTRVAYEPFRRTVLLADDDATLRRALVRLLRKADFDVVDVDTGSKAVAAIEARSFDVILSDVEMPDGGGLDLLAAVRRIDLDVPVVLMSGLPDVESAATAVEYGAFRYLTKPLDMEALGKLLHHAARAHALARLRREASAIGGAQTGAADRAGLEARLEQAIDRMWMAFQPIFDVGTGAVFGVEALLRSNEASMPGPQHILDAATLLHRLAVVGRRVRSLSAGALAASKGSELLFVNLHPEDLADADLVSPDAPLTQLASRVILEVTERSSLTSSTELTLRLAQLRKLGFRIAVDDIGAGYSGLTSFTDLMPEIVKIDMSLVRNVHLSALKQRTISALCKLCHEVNCQVVGEGVETHEERECLVGLGVDLLQGYLLGRPSREWPAMRIKP